MRVYLPVRRRDFGRPAGPVSYVESDVDIDVRTGGHRADHLWGGGLGGRLCVDAVQGGRSIGDGKQRGLRAWIVKRESGPRRDDGLGAAAVPRPGQSVGAPVAATGLSGLQETLLLWRDHVQRIQPGFPIEAFIYLQPNRKGKKKKEKSFGPSGSDSTEGRETQLTFSPGPQFPLASTLGRNFSASAAGGVNDRHLSM